MSVRRLEWTAKTYRIGGNSTGGVGGGIENRVPGMAEAIAVVEAITGARISGGGATIDWSTQMSEIRRDLNSARSGNVQAWSGFNNLFQNVFSGSSSANTNTQQTTTTRPIETRTIPNKNLFNR